MKKLESLANQVPRHGWFERRPGRKLRRQAVDRPGRGNKGGKDQFRAVSDGGSINVQNPIAEFNTPYDSPESVRQIMCQQNPDFSRAADEPQSQVRRHRIGIIPSFRVEAIPTFPDVEFHAN